MKFRFFYDRKPKLTARDTDCFSHGDYKCHHLFQNRRGQPVAISQHKDLGIWKVHHGFSTVFSVRRRKQWLTAGPATRIWTEGRCDP